MIKNDQPQTKQETIRLQSLVVSYRDLEVADVTICGSESTLVFLLQRWHAGCGA